MGSDLSLESWPPESNTSIPQPTTTDLEERIASLRETTQAWEGQVAGIRTECTVLRETCAPFALYEDSESAEDVSASEGEKPPASVHSVQSTVVSEAPPPPPPPPESEPEIEPSVEEDAESSVDEREEVQKWLAETLQKNLIVYVTKTRCPFCAEARNVMAVAEIEAFEINIDEMDEERAEHLQRVIEATTKRYGVPVIWIDGETKDVSELKELYKTGRLQQFLDTRRHLNTESTSQLAYPTHADTESDVSSVSPLSVPPLAECDLPEEYTAEARLPLCHGIGDGLRQEGVLVLDTTNVFLALGAKGIHEVCTLFAHYAFQTPVLANAYKSAGVGQARLVARLTAFLCERCGGPEGAAVCPYLRSSPSILCSPAMLRLTHAGIVIGDEEVTLWLSCMSKSLHQTKSMPRTLIPTMEQYFKGTAWDLCQMRKV